MKRRQNLYETSVMLPVLHICCEALSCIIYFKKTLLPVIIPIFFDFDVGNLNFLNFSCFLIISHTMQSFK